MKGLFITLEGGEGAGKTTVSHFLEKTLGGYGHHILRTREPGGTGLSEQIRHMLLNKNFSFSINTKAEMLLFLASRAQHIEEVIQPAINQGKIVICDRFNDSTVVYQGIARGLGKEKVEQLCDLVCDGLQPDLTLLLDIDPSIGLLRTKTAAKENAPAGEMDKIEEETMQFHEKIREGFLSLAKANPKRYAVIDASKPIDEVYTEATTQVLKAIHTLYA